MGGQVTVQRAYGESDALDPGRGDPGFGHTHNPQAGRQRHEIELIHPGAEREQDLEIGEAPSGLAGGCQAAR